MAATIENLQALGAEIKRQREKQGYRTLAQLQAATGISQQFLSQIENARLDKDRGPVVPSDEKLEKLATALDVPVSRLHALLGRLPDQPFRIYANPETAQVAEDYDALPGWARAIVTDCISSVRRAAEVKEA